MNWHAHIRTAFGASAPDDEIIEELAQHAAAMYHAARADGADDAAAGRTVDEQIAVWVREAPVMRRRPRRAPAIEPPPLSRSSASSFFLDVRYALRLLRHQPGYSAVVIATVALGIAATTVLARVTYGVLLKPLPWADPPRLVRLYEPREGSTRRFPIARRARGSHSPSARSPNRTSRDDTCRCSRRSDGCGRASPRVRRRPKRRRARGPCRPLDPSRWRCSAATAPSR